MKTYDSFNEYIELFVIPRKNENLDQKRLDGREFGGNREILGVFRHRNKVWKVHGDSRYEPLLLAYDVIKKQSKEPFAEKITNGGKGSCLILKDEFQQLLSKPKAKHLYIYEHAVKQI